MNWLRRTFEIAHGKHAPIPSMEGMRGLAVLLVFFVHYVTLVEPWLATETVTAGIATALRRVGNSGVDLFFVLSGFLIYGALIRRHRPFLPFMRRRVARIYPTFLAVFAIYLVLSWLRPAESKIPAETGPAAVYVLQNFLLLPGIFDIRPIITVAWSLSYELFYYLTIPLVVAALALRRWPVRARVLLFLGLSAAWFVFVHVRGAEHLRLVMFLAGILLREALATGRGKNLDALGLPALGLSFVLMLVVEATGASGTWRFVALYACFYVLCLASFARQGVTARTFSWTPLRWLGNMSYSYYLIHGLTLKVAFEGIERIVPPTGEGAAAFWVLLPPLFFLTLVTSAVLFVAVEKPMSLGSTPAPAAVPVKTRA